LPLLLLVTPSPRPALPAAFEPPPILMYHRVDTDRPADAVGRELTVSPEQFREQLAYLRSEGITPVSMAQMEQRLEHGQPLDHIVVVTFDDGYADQYSYAVPLLHAAGGDATFYIITGEIGRARHLTWSQLRAMAAEHMDIAAHGVEHDDLSLMTPAQQAYQIDSSVQTLQRCLHEPVESYAYPSGRFNRATLKLVRQAGIALAVTTDPAYVLAPENRFEMSRVRVRGDWSIHDFAAALRRATLRRQLVVR
jgi:peptidoglycan/xylan/chitin deacetylase (PgdA/CDA1 family)